MGSDRSGDPVGEYSDDDLWKKCGDGAKGVSKWGERKVCLLDVAEVLSEVEESSEQCYQVLWCG